MTDKLTIKEKEYNLKDHTLIMGILNVTPDSFSDGGNYIDPQKAVQHALQMIEEGAHIIDVGGESTRPGFAAVSAEEEKARVIPVIRAIAAATDVPISIDSYKADVAEAALEAGAAMLNDVYGGKRDPDMLKLAAKADVPICLMHNRNEALYQDLLAEIKADLLESVALAQEAGVRKENIILDPGIGFGKTPAHNLAVMQRLDELTALGYPMLLGTSRKSMIGKVLDLPVEERVEGTAATVAYGITRGCRIVRVHDILAMSRVARMTDAMLAGRFLDG
ncbi:dihydropteroate synthase [Dethiobacter alkaliphilus]|uniref:Dihydropteroate synthase n=1 Tax=Dethiobacter alkaliphilus AHT 1 TaxID=555088 RepID=C0GCX7_DETAL|nr:dihydropteroate synthase [Dethiobacter alkaliphilus]EEG79062.1 dihydropteroate synthase [Dethiobacter alkaliphilus AHT 1]